MPKRETFEFFNGDSAEVLFKLKPLSIDLVVTSPPYDDLREYKGYSFDFERIAEGLVRVLKPGGVIVWIVNDATVGGSETGTSFRQALHFKNLGLNLHDTMIWFKSNAIPLSHNRYDPAFEYMFVLSRGSPKSWNGLRQKTLNPGGTINRASCVKYAQESKAAGRVRSEKTVIGETTLYKNVWDIPIGCDRSNSTSHPAPFPLALALDHIKSWSNPGDRVLDPFMGSGTTGVAAAALGRKFTGIEISDEYFQLAVNRIKLGAKEKPA